MNFQLIKQILRNSSQQKQLPKKNKNYSKVNEMINQKSTSKSKKLNSNGIQFNEAINLNQFRKQLINVCNMRSVDDPIVLIIKKITYQNTILKQQIKSLEEEILQLQQQKISQTRIRKRDKRSNSIKCLQKDTLSNLYNFVISNNSIKEFKSNATLKDKVINKTDQLSSSSQIKTQNGKPEDLRLQIRFLNQELQKKNTQIIELRKHITEIQNQLNQKNNSTKLQKKFQRHNTDTKINISTIKQVDSSQQVSQINQKNDQIDSHIDIYAILAENKILKDLQTINEQEIEIQKQQIQWLRNRCEQMQVKIQNQDMNKENQQLIKPQYKKQKKEKVKII